MPYRDLEHPDITRVRRDGLPAAQEVFCPVCGQECYTFYKVQGEIVGCYMCVEKVDADEAFN